MSTSLPGSTVSKPGRRLMTGKDVTSSNRKSVDATSRPLRKPRVTESEIVGWLGGDDFAGPQSNLAATQSIVRPVRPLPGSQPQSDEDLARRARERLNERNHPGFQAIELEVQNRIVIVRGTVRSKGERVLLLHILKHTTGVEKVIDCLTTVRASAPRQPLRLPEFQFNVSLPTGLTIPAVPLKRGHIGAILAAVVSLSVLVWFGTGSQSVAVHRVTGRVVLEGAAIPRASVVLHPVGKTKLPKGLTPRATAKEDGAFAVATFSDADGAPEGEFIATVHLLKPVVVDGDTIPGPNVLPEVYSRPETSPFRLNISRDTKELAVLELHKSPTR